MLQVLLRHYNLDPVTTALTSFEKEKVFSTTFTQSLQP